MKTLKTFLLFALLLLSAEYIYAQDQGNKASSSHEQVMISAADIIKSYVIDYRKDRYAADPIQFGIDVPEHGQWTVKVTGQQQGEEWEVSLTDGLPTEKTFPLY